MKCKKVRELMGAYVYGDLAPHEMKDIRLHAQECAECCEELRTRALVVDAIPSAAPSLSDDDRQRIMWSVKGAIKAKEREERSVLLRVAPAFGLAAVLALGLGIGAIISSNHTKPPPKGQTPVVHVRPHPLESSSRTAQSHPKPDASATTDTNTPEKPQVAIKPAFRLPLATNGIGGLSGRRLPPNSKRSYIVPSDAPLPVAPGTGNLTEPDEPWKLPQPVDVEDADSTPKPPDQ